MIYALRDLLSGKLGHKMFLVCATSNGGWHDSPEKARFGRWPHGRGGFLGFWFVILPVLGCVLSGESAVHHQDHGLSGFWLVGNKGNLPALRVRVNTP